MTSLRLLTCCLLRAFTAPRVLLLAGTALLTPAIAAAQSATGSVSGRIYNPATREYVRNAEVRLAGTALLTESESDGIEFADYDDDVIAAPAPRKTVAAPAVSAPKVPVTATGEIDLDAI